MFRFGFKQALVVLALSVLAGCGATGNFKTDYETGVAAQQSASWRLGSVTVNVPDSLTVSEANTYAPDADIVWRGEPRGDRYEQVRGIIAEAAQRGASGLPGRRAVNVHLQVTQFHALTERTRYTLSSSGVHNIDFIIRVTDARSGEVLAGPEAVQADLVGYVGNEALAAEARGETQRVRIIDHVSRTIAGWLGIGADMRGIVRRAGR